jgi:hypothetical protein
MMAIRKRYWAWAALAGIAAGCVMETRPEPPVILFLGNSITQSLTDSSIGWTFTRGMAASTLEKDYVHQTVRMLKEKGLELKPVIGSRDCIVCDGVINEYLERIDDVLTIRPRYAVIQLGENSDLIQIRSGRLTREYLALLTALKERGVKKIFCMTNWDEARLEDVHNDAILRAIRHYPDVRVVDITSLAKHGENYGDSSLFTNVDVLWHPGDKGMERMAESLSRAIWEDR